MRYEKWKFLGESCYSFANVIGPMLTQFWEITVATTIYSEFTVNLNHSRNARTLNVGVCISVCVLVNACECVYCVNEQLYLMCTLYLNKKCYVDTYSDG